MNDKMKEAVLEATNGISNGDGGPFGAVIVDKDGNIIARAHNEVIKTNDPTAHAEILAIRKASQRLGRFNLSDCTLYTSSEPCPMCMSAIYWARIPKVYYACNREDAKNIGFDDSFIYDVLEGKKPHTVELIETDKTEALAVFKKWSDNPNKIPY